MCGKRTILRWAIIGLDENLISVAMNDLLSEEEIKALVNCLRKLKAELQNAELLEPDQWSQLANDLINEDKSYYSELIRKSNL